ncbi:hypothetical protein [Novosphingobium sp. TH158]|uniref:hypothetical protein n=1 Tax=Novosphingobium sp. TH158 TaxID=2067455 RepID=UPI001181B819|nr:hypothetical protein [Novosphingobium sp. TH158]
MRATDAAGNISYQTINITVTNVDEIAAKLAEIGGRLRADLRNYAFNSLQDSLAFNEGMMQDSADDDASCGSGNAKKATSGSMQANEAQQNINLKYAQQLNACNARIRVLLDMGLAVTNRAGNTTVRTLASLRGERKLGNDVTLGLGVMGSWASDKLQSFATSHISDKAYQANAYMRVKLAPELRMGAFASFGHASYNFDLADGGMSLTGKMGGNRVAFGGMLTGDFNLAGLGVSTDIALSHASESLKNATLAAQYRGESRTGIAFAVGTVDATRLSVPFHFGLIGKANAKGESGGNLLTVSPGLLCEDANADATGLTCGFQVGGRYKQKLSQRDRISLEARFEKVAGIERSIFSLGFGHSFGPLEMLMAVNQEMTRFAQDSRAMLSLRLLNR